ncbi:MAG: DUF6789 family protein [Bradymonadaceae bacterium]
MWNHINIVKAIVAGLLGTAVMTAFMLMAPLMGMPPMNIGEMLGSMMGGITSLGWVMHFMIGTVLAIGYAAIFATRLPGPPAARGAIFSLIPWLMAQVVVMPMMGAGFFSGSMLVAGGSLVAHLIFGVVVGGVYGTEAKARTGRLVPQT